MELYNLISYPVSLIGGVRVRLRLFHNLVDLPKMRTKRQNSSFICRTAMYSLDSLPDGLFPKCYNLGLFITKVSKFYVSYACFQADTAMRTYFMLKDIIIDNFNTIVNNLSMKINYRPTRVYMGPPKLYKICSEYVTVSLIPQC